MAAVQSASRAEVQSSPSGIRPFELSRDLRPVAELIADAFAHELDERGAAALREMRAMSRMGGLLGVLNLATGEFKDFFGGFVWVENGKVVGNITVQRADKYGARWQIANVAVAPPYRGRGISRRLMERAISHIREQGGKWAVLQVYAENTVARTLYDHLGFESLGGIIDLKAPRAPRVPAPSPAAGLESFPASHWQPLYELANNQLGANAQWWRSLRRADYEVAFEQQTSEWVWQTLGRRRIYRRCVQSGARFEAAVVLTAERWRAPHRLQLWVRPEHYGRLEQPLVQWALHTLADFPNFPVIVSVPTDHAAAQSVLQHAGFVPVRTLLTMRLPVVP